MKQIYSSVAMLFIAAMSFAQQPIITAIVDGDCSGGNPKLLEIYADGAVDFTLYSLENQTNTSTTWGATQDLSSFGTVTDAFVYVTTTGSAASLATEFPSLTAGAALESGVINLNGDDRIRIINTATMAVIDQYGVDSLDGSGETWEYADSYAKRVDGTGPDAGFTEANWTIPGAGTLNGLGTCQGGTDTFETLIGGLGTYSTTASTTPVVSITGSVSGLDYFEGNGPSTEQSFNVSGLNLTQDITVNAPMNFEVAAIAAGPYGASTTVTQTAGTAATTTVYVRLAAGLSVGSYTDDVMAISGAANATLSITGVVNPAVPQISVFGTVNSLDYQFGNGPSSEDSFFVEGLFLTSDITITAPANFEVSLTSGSGFASTVTVPQTAGTAANTEIFARLIAGLAENTYTGDAMVAATSVTTETVALTGMVTPAATCANAGDIIITEIMQNPDAVLDNVGEYFEVYNTTAAAIDIVGWEIVDLTNANENFTIITSVVVPANGYAVLVANADPLVNGGITAAYAYNGSTTFLGNGSDEISIQCGGNVIDEVSWDNGATFPDAQGISMELALNRFNATDNDLGANWSVAVTAYGDGDLGTPGTANDFTLSNEQFNQNSFKMYPNPINGGNLTIEAANSESIDVVIYSTLGQQVISLKDVTRSINVSTLNSGLYIVKISQNGNSQTRKLVVQ